MIKATELRLGYWVQVVGVYKGSIDRAGIVKVDAELIWLSEQNKILLMGVSLTPEWLERCAIGFFEADTAMESLINLLYKGAVIATFKRDSLPPCKFVHQLQNLIQSLTGTELEIKLP